MGKRRPPPWKYARGERQRFEALWAALNSATDCEGRIFHGSLGLLSILTGLHVTEVRHLLKRMAMAGVVADRVPGVPIQPWLDFRVTLGRSPAKAAEDT